MHSQFEPAFVSEHDSLPRLTGRLLLLAPENPPKSRGFSHFTARPHGAKVQSQRLSASANRLFAAPSQIREKCNQFLREPVICHAPIRQGASLDIENMVIL
jgi:hypothetical protein